MSSTDELIILTVDDNPLMGDALSSICNDVSSGMKVYSHFLSGDGVSNAAVEVRPKVILMDFDMPGTDTIALIREVVRDAPETRILMLSGHLNAEDIDACIEAGASGYIHKSNDADYIRDAVQKVALGEFVICDDAARAVGMK